MHLKKLKKKYRRKFITNFSYKWVKMHTRAKLLNETQPNEFVTKSVTRDQNSRKPWSDFSGRYS